MGVVHYVEPETRENSRMDIVIVYGEEEHIVEIKIWHGEKYRQDGIVQLEEYLDSRNATKGYLLSFSFLKNKEYTKQWIETETKGYKVFEVTV